MYIYTERARDRGRKRDGLIDFKVLAHEVMEAGKPQIYRVVQQDGDPG